MMPSAVVLCGGLGTRLRSVVQDRPKVLAPVNGRPFLDYVLRRLIDEGVEEILLSSGYMGDMLEAYVAGSDWAADIRCVVEPEPLGTGGALRFVAEREGLRAPFLVLNGDTHFGGSLRTLVARHRAQACAKATLALVRVEQADRYGTVNLEQETGRIVGFEEKKAGTAPSAWINAGVYVLAPALLDEVAPGRQVSLEREVFPRWLGGGLYGAPFPEAMFIDIGIPEDYRRAGALLSDL